MPTLNLGRVGFVNKGVWLISTAYKINDTVTYLGGTYACLIANTGQTPILGGTIYWQEWVANNTVKNIGDETIGGIKTFTSSPILPTPSLGDNTTKGATTAFVIAELPNQIHTATSKTTPVDADEIPISDSAATFGLKKVTWLNLKTTLKAYFDTIYIAITSALASGVRQTVQSASVDTSGFANYISIGTGLAVNIAATTVPIKIHAAGGAVSNDRIGTISADTSITGLTANTTNYLYADVASNGVVTLSANVVAHLEQFGGTPAVTNNLLTFNIGEMTGYTGNGATAPQTWRVPIGEAVTNATNVTSVVNYALNGLYDSGYTNTLPTNASQTIKNHNVGTVPKITNFVVKCLTAESGFAIGDIVYNTYSSAASNGTISYIVSSKAITYRAINSTNPQAALNATTGALVALTNANWAYKFEAERGW